MEKPSLNIEWKQEGNKLYFNFKDTEIYFIMPEGFKLENTHKDLLKLAEYFMFSPWYETLGEHKFSRQRGKNFGLSFSTGVDSTAVALLYPYAKLVYIERDNITWGQLNQDNAFRMIKQMDKPVTIIKTNFELIPTFFDEQVGYPTPIGMGVPVILLADYLDLGILSYGKVLDDQYFPDGIFRDFTKGYKRQQELILNSGMVGFYPVVGCSEVITTDIVDKSKYKDISISCIRGKDGIPCSTCFKCFRKRLLRHQGVWINEETMRYTSKKFPKMATSLLYAMKKYNVDLKLLNMEYLKDKDVSMLNKIYTPAYNEYPNEMVMDLLERLHKLGYKNMSKEEEEILKNLNFVRPETEDINV